VVAIDISPEMILLARRRAEDAGLAHRIETRAASGEELDFPENSFDIVYGHSILHHLTLDITLPRMTRILKPGGLAAFLEPLDHNPLINGFRRLTPHRRTPTEKPLSFRQLQEIGAFFKSWEHREFYLVSLVAFVWYYGLRNQTLFRRTLRVLQPVDRILFILFPYLRRFAWVTVLRMKR
jgi:ubiquinone/menaquinone biosynthesis C-methylase UbiE